MKTILAVVCSILLLAAIPASSQSGLGSGQGYGSYGDDGGVDQGYDDYEDDGDFGYYGDDSGEPLSDYMDQYVCFQCPSCQQIFRLTPLEAEYANPYTLCPSCGRAYAYSFLPVACPGEEGLDDGTAVQTDGGLQVDSGRPDPLLAGGKSTAGGGIAAFMNAANSSEGSDLAPGRILMVVPPRDFRDEELDVPRDIFTRSGYQVLVASNGTTRAQGMLGGEAPVDLEVKNVDVSDYLAVVYVGGMGVEDLLLYQNPDYLALADAASQADLTIGAICLAPKILASAGVLEGRNATVSPGEDAYITARGARYLDQPVVRDGRIITGDGPEASEEFATTILEVLAESSGAGSTEEEGDATEAGQVREVDGALAIPL